MKKKRIVSLVLTLVMMLSAIAVAAPTASAVTNEVRLLYAEPKTYYSTEIPGWYAYLYTEGYVEVQNIGYAKNVTIHYTYNGTDWFDTAATYYKATVGNYEAWHFQTDPNTVEYPYRSGSYCRFAIKYEVNGQTYWDNNNGQNYMVRKGRVGSDIYAIGSAGLKLEYGRAYDRQLSGNIQVKNLGYAKDIKVHYSTDGWATSSTVNATYSGQFTEYGGIPLPYPTDVELWTFSTPTLPADATEVEYSLTYTVNGVTYWDNNFNNNYVATIYD